MKRVTHFSWICVRAVKCGPSLTHGSLHGLEVSSFRVHASVLNVVAVTDFRVSCTPCLTFLCTLLALGCVQLFGILGLVQRMDLGNFS